jgi:hypothetical protein
MPSHEHSFDSFSVFARAQLGIPDAPTEIDRRVVVSMGLELAHLATERPLIRSILAVGVVAPVAFLGTVRTENRGRLYPTFLAIPLDLGGDMP